MWSRTTTEDEEKELARLSRMKGTPVNYSDSDAPRTDSSRKIYQGTPSFSKNMSERVEAGKS
jgi:hypothetical protein